MFALYLAGFLLYRSWWYQCHNGADTSSPVSPVSVSSLANLAVCSRKKLADIKVVCLLSIAIFL